MTLRPTLIVHQEATSFLQLCLWLLVGAVMIHLVPCSLISMEQALSLFGVMTVQKSKVLKALISTLNEVSTYLPKLRFLNQKLIN